MSLAETTPDYRLRAVVARLETELETARLDAAATRGTNRAASHARDVALRELEELKLELQQARAEALEQARLLGMSGSREAGLRGELEQLRRALERAQSKAQEQH